MLFRIQPSSTTPIYRQIVRQVREAVARGTLSPGDRLPSLRQAGRELVVNYLTVKQAYDILEREGVIETRRGRGAFVRATAGDALQRQVDADLQQRLDDVAAGARRAGLSRAQFEKIARRAWESQETRETQETQKSPAPPASPETRS